MGSNDKMTEHVNNVCRKSKSILTEANNLVHGERNESYGHPLDDFSRTAKIWSAILGIGVTPEQVGLCMIGVKLSRQCNRPKRDNMVDAAGYAETVDWVMEEKERRRKTWVDIEQKKEIQISPSKHEIRQAEMYERMDGLKIRTTQDTIKKGD